jgi:hypothetical protein
VADGDNGMSATLDLIAGLPLTMSNGGSEHPPEIIAAGGIIGNALYVKTSSFCGTDPTFDIGPTSELSITGWFKNQATGSGSDPHHVDVNIAGQSSDSIFQFSVYPGSKFLYIFVESNSDFQDKTIAGGTPTGSGYQWIYAEFKEGLLTVQFDNAGTIHTTDAPVLLDTDVAAFNINGSSGIAEPGEKAYMDEWAIWPQALTSEQKAILFNAGAGCTWPVDLPL